MNTKQKIVLWVGIVSFIFIGIFPPWIYVCVSRQSIVLPRTSFHYIKTAGYHFLWSPPSQYFESHRLPTFEEIRAGSTKEITEQHRLSINGLVVTEVRLNVERLLAQYVIALPVLGLLFTFAFGAKRHTQKTPQKKTSQKSQASFLKNGLKAPAGSGFQSGKEFLSYLLRGLSKR